MPEENKQKSAITLDSAGCEAVPVCCVAANIDNVDHAVTGSVTAGNSDQTVNSSAMAHQTFTPLSAPQDFSALEMAMLPTTMVLGTGAMIAGHKVHKTFANKVNTITKEKLRVEEKILQAQNDNNHEAIKSYKAYKIYLDQQLDRAEFQKLWAGKIAPINTGIIMLGEFFPFLAPVGILFGLSAIGLAHMHNTYNVAKKDAQKIKRAKHDLDLFSDKSSLSYKDALIRKKFFSKERKLALANLLGWGLFSAGAGVFGLSLLTSWGLTPIVPPLFAYTAGAGALAAGVAGTIYTNTQYALRITDVPGYAWKEIGGGAKNPLTHDQVKQHNIDSYNSGLIAQQYRDKFFKNLSLTTKTIRNFRRYLQKIITYSTFTLVSALRMKFSTKVFATTKASKEMDNWRINALDSLKDKAEAISNINSLIMTNEGQSTSHKIGHLLEKIKQSGHYGNIAKILAHRISYIYKGAKVEQEVSVIKKDWLLRAKTDKNGNIISKKVTKKIAPHLLDLKDKYKELFPNLTEDKNSQSNPIQIVKALRGYGACCDANNEGMQIFDNIRNNFCNSDGLFANDTKKQELMLKLLQEITDHYLIFQLPKNAREQVSIWSNISDNFALLEQTQEQEKDSKDYNSLTQQNNLSKHSSLSCARSEAIFPNHSNAPALG